ncbi:MAG: type II toxin-antitoxin system RelE/ParE family toxin [Bryobacteraceae bacterium]
MRIEWSASTVADLQAIAEWIEQDRGANTANCITRIIYEVVQSLRTMPYPGRYGRLEKCPRTRPPTASEVIREALRLLEEHDVARARLERKSSEQRREPRA